MPAIFSKEKVDAIFKAFMAEDLCRSEIAVKFNMDADNVDKHLLSALKRYCTPALIYGALKNNSKQISLLPLRDIDKADTVLEKKHYTHDARKEDTRLEEKKIVVSKKVFIRPPAKYSNQVSSYKPFGYTSLLERK